MRSVAFVGLLLLAGSCARSADSAGKEAKASAAGPAAFSGSALAPIAREVAALADAAIAGKPATPQHFRLPAGAPTLHFTAAPRGKVSWRLFFVETGVTAKKTGGGIVRFKLGLTVGPAGLRLSEARGRSEADPAEPPKALQVPAPISETIREIFATAQRGEFQTLALTSADFAGVASPKMAEKLLAEAQKFDPATAELAKLAGPILQIEVDDIGLIGVDEGGVVFIAGADLDPVGEEYGFDKDEEGNVFTAAAVPFLDAPAWQADLKMVCELAGAVKREAVAGKSLPQAFQERLEATKMSAVARQMFGAWARSPEALSQAHALRILEEAGGPKDWSCPAMEAIFGWQAPAAPLSR